MLSFVALLFYKAEANLDLLRDFYNHEERSIILKVKQRAMERDNKDIIFLFGNANRLNDLSSARFFVCDHKRYELLECFLNGVEHKRVFRFHEGLSFFTRCKTRGEFILNRTVDRRFLAQVEYQIRICKSFLQMDLESNCLHLIDPVKREMLSKYYGTYVHGIYDKMENIHASSTSLEKVFSEIQAEKDDDIRFMLKQLFLYLNNH